MNSVKKNKKWIAIIGSLLAIIVVVLLARNFLTNRNSQAAQANSGDIVAAFVGDLSAAATASGKIEAQRSAQLALKTTGEIEAVLVEVGDLVQAGDPLLNTKTADLERAILNAQQALVIQEANFASLLAPASKADILAAEAAVASTQANLNDLLDGPNEDEVAAAEADVRAANGDIGAAAARLNDARPSGGEAEIRDAQLQLEIAQRAATSAAEQHRTILVTEPNRFIGADDLAEIEEQLRAQAAQANADLLAVQEAYDRVVSGDANAISGSQAGLALATANRDAAQARLDQILAGATAAQIAAAESSLAQAKANLDKLLRGPTEAQIALQEAQVEQARISLKRAENNLTEATLTAPFNGMVTAVHVSPGEQGSGIVVEMVDSNSLEVILDVDEVDIGDMSVGRKAIITLETWPDREIDGEIVAIAPTANQENSALVTYAVNLSLAETDLPILVGMTANANLLTNNLENVLLVPNAAINADRSAGTFSVNLVTNDETDAQITTETKVTIGLRDNNYTQITSGIEEGDQVLIGNDLPVFEFGQRPNNDN